MPNYRRARVPGGTFFFTVVTFRRRPVFARPPARKLFGATLRAVRERRPFTLDAIVLLPDHLHVLMTLPRDDDDFAIRWKQIKTGFTKAFLATIGTDAEVSDGKRREGRRGVWQPRYWEHTVTDEDDFARHFDYIHFNPVKHGLARCPRDWPASSFHRWVRRGVYDANWACGNDEPPTDGEFGEP